MNIPEYLTDDEDFLEFFDVVVNPRMPRTYKERPNNFLIWNDKQFLQRFRLSKHTVRMIIDEIREDIQNETEQ